MIAFMPKTRAYGAGLPYALSEGAGVALVLNMQIPSEYKCSPDPKPRWQKPASERVESDICHFLIISNTKTSVEPPLPE